MDNKHRVPILRKVQRMVLYITCAALLLTSIVGIFSMIEIRGISADSLITQMEHNLNNIAVNKADLADSELEKYMGTVKNFAEYLHGLYLDPEAYKLREIEPSRIENANIYAMQRALTGKNIDIKEVMSDVLLLGNVEHIWRSFMNDNKDITSIIYLGTKKGLMIAYDNRSQESIPPEGEEVYFDYFDSEWYKLGESTRDTFFTDVYNDSLGRGLMITCASPFYDANGEFVGVVAMDILISDLYRAIVDLDLGADSYAFLVDSKGEIISGTAETESKTLTQDKDMDSAIAQKILAGETGVSLSGSKIYYAYTPIKSTGWKFCVRIPESVILQPLDSVDSNIIRMIAIFVLSFVLILAATTFIARKFSERITTPIAALGRDVKEISSGDLDYRAEIRTNDEIGDLAQSFNDMAASLKEYVKNLAAVTAEKERIGAELDIATQIQADMLPRIVPPYLNHEKFDIYASMNPAKEVGGDFYDFFFIDDDHLALVIADVSGKGVPAALFMVIAKTMIKNRAQMGGTPREILADVNNQLCEGNEADLFVTVWLGILDLNTGHVAAANAGHEYPAIRRVGGKYELFKTKQSPAVATMEGLRFRESEFTLGHGDNLYIYTDGVPEATNINEELYGTDRMLEKLNTTIGMNTADILETMRKDVYDFTGEAPQFDDITMLCLQFKGGKEDGMHELIIDAKTEKLDDVIDFIDQHLEEWDCPMKTMTQINIAVEEIFVNIAHYAYENGGTAKITLRHLNNDVEITFTDSGVPYNPLEREDPDITLSAEEREIGGLGIYIVKKSMDSVSYEYRDNSNILKLRKSIE